MRKLAMLSIAFAVSVFAAAPSPVRRISVDQYGGEANGYSITPFQNRAITEDGQFVAFVSAADNLVPSDTNSTYDIFLKDLFTGDIERVNLDSSGRETPPGSHSDIPAVSSGAAYVAFDTDAALDPADVNGLHDVYVRDRTGRTTTRVSVGALGQEPNGQSFAPFISINGRYVLFTSNATNLVASDTNNANDVFLYDQAYGTTERISVDSFGREGNSSSSARGMSADTRYVLFESIASNLVPNDTNGAEDLFVRDRLLNTTTRVSVDSAGNEANGSSSDGTLSADGNYLAFQSAATNLVAGDINGLDDIFLKDLRSGNVTLVSLGPSGQANGASRNPVVTQHGRYVIFTSGADNLIALDTNGYEDVFVRDVLLKTTTRLNEGPRGRQVYGFSAGTGVDATGLRVLFISEAPGLVANDTNGVYDVFVRLRDGEPGFTPDK